MQSTSPEAPDEPEQTNRNVSMNSERTGRHYQQDNAQVLAQVWTFFATITAVGAKTCEPDYPDSFEATLHLDENRTQCVGDVTVAPSRNEEGHRVIRRLDDQVLEYLRALLAPDDWHHATHAMRAAVDVEGYERLVIDALREFSRPTTVVDVAKGLGVPVGPIERAMVGLSAHGTIQENAPTDDGLSTFLLENHDGLGNRITEAVVVKLLATCNINWRNGSVRVDGGITYFEVHSDEEETSANAALQRVGVGTWVSNSLAHRLATWTDDVAEWFADHQELLAIRRGDGTPGVSGA